MGTVGVFKQKNSKYGTLYSFLSYLFSLGAILVDQYCNPLADVTLESVSLQLDEMTEKVKKMLRLKNPSHPSLRCAPGDFIYIYIYSCKVMPVMRLTLCNYDFVYHVGNCIVVEDFELQRQVLCALNTVLYEQLQYKGNEFDYYNPLNSYIHQVR